MRGRLRAASARSRPRFSVPCYCLVLLLEDHRVLTQPQRLMAYYILNDFYRAEQPSTNPFMSIIVDDATDESSDSVERAFILQALSNNSKEIARKSAAEFISGVDIATHLGLTSLLCKS